MFARARIGLGKAFSIVIIVTAVFSAGGYFWASNEFLKTENRDVYQFKTDLLRDKVSQNPADLNSQLDLVISQYLQGKTADAFKTCQSVLEQDPQNTSALLYMGLIKVDMKDYQNAIPLLEKVVGVNPVVQPRLLYYNLGIAYFQTGSFANAAKTLDLACKVDPGSGPANFYLGMSYFKLAKYQNARTPLERAVSLGINTVEAEKALQVINSHLKKQTSKQSLTKK